MKANGFWDQNWLGWTTNQPLVAFLNNQGLTDEDKPKWGQETESPCGPPELVCSTQEEVLPPLGTIT